MLLKIYNFCLKYPKSLALIVRKEFTDLRDSTLKDFEFYFNATVDSNKEYKLQNGSIIMFRHGAELNVLKNVNLSIFGMEQAEEFENEETFTFLRDRIRRKGSPYRQGIIIANAHGHNWIWRMWINNPSSNKYHIIQANTFDNQDNLPEDFISDLQSMEKEAPAHYQRYVKNSHEDLEDADLLISYNLIEKAEKNSFFAEGAKILSCDVARFGDCKTVFTILQKANMGWKQIYLSAFCGQDTVRTHGEIIDLMRRYNTDFHVVDDIGVGGGVVDNLRASQVERIFPFKSGSNAINTEEFFHLRDECYWALRELLNKGELQLIHNDEQTSQLTSLKFKYDTKARKKILSKDEMRQIGLKSPDYADALMMCMVVLHQAQNFSAKPYVLYGKRNYSYYPMSYGRKLEYTHTH